MSLRRVIDLGAAACALFLLAPAFALIAIVIKATSSGPVFFFGTRVGKHGRLFQAYKFRTMIVSNGDSGPGITVAFDPRVTPIGRVLRRWKLDELPQLVNIVKGEMSFVGPRPEDPRYVSLYSTEQMDLLEFPPGLTGAASLVFWDEESLLTGPDWESKYVRDIMPSKFRIEAEYVKRRTLISDFEIIVKTICRGILKKERLCARFNLDHLRTLLPGRDLHRVHSDEDRGESGGPVRS